MKVFEDIDRRVLGALRLVDNTTAALIRRPMKVTADDVRFISNLSSYYVMRTAPGLDAHINEFEAPPSQPPLESVEIAVSVEDPVKSYLPRITTVDLPRDPDPTATLAAGSLFRPVDVLMYRASNASTNVNWSVIRGSVFRLNNQDNRISIPGALLTVIRTVDEEELARGLSDSRGEFLVTVSGIPITNFSSGENDDDDTPDGPVITSETPVRLEVIVDPDVPWPVNPDVLENNRASWLRNADQPTLLTLRTGQTATVAIEVDLSDGS